jgi:spore maturation protein CgeB
MSGYFPKNILELEKQHPDLAKDLRKIGINKYQLRKAPSKGGVFELLYKEKWYTWQYPQIENHPSKKAVLLLGAGSGHICLDILQKFPSKKVVIWDCELSRLHLLFRICDVSSYIRQGRLKIIYGVEILSWKKIKTRVQAYILPMIRQQGSSILEFFQGPDEIKNLFLIGEGGLYVEDVCSFIKDRGHMTLQMSMTKWQLKYMLKWKPKAIITINFIPYLEYFCEEHKLPYVCWEIDPNMDAMDSYPMKKSKYQYTKMFTYRKKHIPLYERIGIQSTYLPLASPIYRKETTSGPNYKRNLVFVGSSMNEEGKKSIAKLHFLLKKKLPPPKIKEFIARAILHQKTNPDTYVIDNFFETHLPASKLWFPKENLPILLGEYCASMRRLEYCKMVAKWGLDIWGDKGWEELKDSQANIRGEIGYFKEINHVYSNGGIHLDINRLYQNDMITLRVFEVLACGGFILAEYSDALAEIFDIGTDIEAWKTKEELLDKIEFYIDKPELRDTIRRRGQGIVLKKHMFAQKMNYILDSMDIKI